MNDSKSWLDQKLGQKTKYLCYPVGRCNNQTAIAAQKSVYARATTTRPGSANTGEGTYGLKRVRIVSNISDSGFVQLISTGCWKHAVALFGVDCIFLL
ncbi:polysaccharide deacetylase family protein [Ligilactobacillus ruminis]|uniref:polysaccharide deacetylase family protein n=1 Tax=Ligilactobacillus ruminis TaxID=1623 RepID=UPI0002EC9438|nr:polysaccharide deacetylase family protein [Ligilactobacillus ruminis]